MRKVYRLRSNLSKTTVYNLIKETLLLVSEEVPPMRKCEFDKYRNTYWLRYSIGYFDYKVTFAAFGDVIGIRVYMRSYENFGDDLPRRLNKHDFTFEYLQEHGLLQELEVK